MDQSVQRVAGEAMDAFLKMETRLWKLEGLESHRSEVEAAAGMPLEQLVTTATEAVAKAAASKATPPLGLVHPRNDGDNLWRAIQAARAKTKKAKTGPVRRWLEKCREPFLTGHGKMASCMHDDDAPWDVCTLTTIIQAFLPEVFMPRLGCQLHRAKELLIGVLHATESRNRRAHSEMMEHTMPSEAEAVDAMQQMGDVLAQCGCTDGAAEMTELLTSAQELVERARKADQESTAALPTETVSVSCNESATLVRRRALFAFESRLQATAGEFHFVNGSISFGDKQDGTVVNTWNGEGRKRIQDSKIKNMLKRVAAARHSLFHVTSHGAELADDVADVGVVLHRLDGIKDGVPTTVGCSAPADWSWECWAPPAKTKDVNLTITLKVTGQRMSIPKGREQCLVGRDDEVKKVVGAALAGDRSRALIHGPPGVGEDVTAVEAVLDDAVKLNLELTTQAWLQGSTDEMFRRQLVRLFATQRPNVVRGSGDQAATLAKIKEWLAANPSCWLFVVEDANADSKSI